MRRKVALYIAGQPVDLGEGSLLLFNYAKDDLDSPAAVKNSYTQKVTLPGTERNNRIFGSFVRSDRETLYDDDKYAGAWFDPLRQTPFTLYREDGTIAESGYAKLEGVARKGASVEYEVTLYGGLGSLLYGLTYNADGDRLTLADLAYTDAADPAHELDFTVGADAVRAAWARLGGDSSKAAMWDVINFAPCYNGIPSGDFSADRAVCKAADCGLPAQSGDHSAGDGGLVLVDLPQEFTEWEVKDLRSYLQRPAVSVRRIVEACCDPRNNGGWGVELDDAFFNEDNPLWTKTWMTLPLLPDVQLEVKTGSTALNLPLTAHNLDVVITGTGGKVGEYDVTVKVVPSLGLTIVDGSDKHLEMHLTMHSPTFPTSQTWQYVSWIELKLEGRTVDNRVVDSVTTTFGSLSQSFDGNPVAEHVGDFTRQGKWTGDPIELSVSGLDISTVSLQAQVKYAIFGVVLGPYPTEVPPLMVWDEGDVTSYQQGHQLQGYPLSTTGSTASWQTPDRVRSGVGVTKADLLRTEHTPADYLLSYCKAMGLAFLRDPAERKVSILSRATFYDGGLKDISSRVDLTEAKVTPSVASARWYEFLAPPGDGEFAEWYRNKYGREYGLQRVNTGYEFNSDAQDVTDGLAYAGAVTAQESSPYYADVRSGGTVIPSVFVYPGATYDLYDDEGNAEEQEVPAVPEGAQTSWYGDVMQLDLFAKPQMHGGDGSPVDGQDVLLFFRGMEAVPQGFTGYALTDDTSDMMLRNDNRACWLLNAAVTDPDAEVRSLPGFGRYLERGSGLITLDFGAPAELAFPAEGAQVTALYEQRWADFFSDRYETDSRVLTCRVDWTGYDVGEALFRNFYAFDGAVWALNRITDWSPETWDRTECEFIRVQDMDNYK